MSLYKANITKLYKDILAFYIKWSNVSLAETTSEITAKDIIDEMYKNYNSPRAITVNTRYRLKRVIFE